MIKKAARRAWRSLIVLELRSRKAGKNQEDEVRSTRSSWHPGISAEANSSPRAALRCPWQEPWLRCVFLLPESQLWLALCFSQVWGWGAPVTTSTETVSRWGRGRSIQGERQGRGSRCCKRRMRTVPHGWRSSLEKILWQVDWIFQGSLKGRSRMAVGSL